jgi:hypothetical protein
MPTIKRNIKMVVKKNAKAQKTDPIWFDVEQCIGRYR